MTNRPNGHIGQTSWLGRIRDITVKWRWPLLIVGALLLGFSVIFPRIGLIEWVALLPALPVILMYTADPTVRYRRLYGMGVVFFLCFYVVNFHWFLYMYPLDFAEMSRPASAVVVGFAWIGLSAFQAAGAAVIFPLLAVAVRGKWMSRHPLLHPLLFAVAWTILEWWQAHSGWSGVPWARLSLGQAEFLPALQSAAFLGSYVITFLIVAVNGLLAYILLHPNRRILCASIACGLFLGNIGVGLVRIHTYEDEGEPLAVAAIQGNKGSLDYWSSGSMDEVMDTYGALSREAAAAGADLIVWPETSIPANIDRSTKVYTFVTELAMECGVPILCGLFTAVEEGSPADYNSMVAVLPDGTIHDTVYNKRNPVPFGEFVPFRDLVMLLVPPLANINTLSEDIPAGEDSVVFDLEEGMVGSLICFDSIYETNARDSISNGAELLAVSTNDSWFRDSRGVWMHHAQSQLRAIETGRYVVRSAVTGVSSVITPTGGVVGYLEPLVTGYVLEDVYLNRNTTVYMAIGDVFVYAACAVAVVALLLPVCETAYGAYQRRRDRR